MDDARAVRTELEQLALAGEGWHALLARLGAVTGRRTWLVAVHGGVLATSDSAEVCPAASMPASGIPASDSVVGGLEAADVRRLMLHDAAETVTCVGGATARAVPVRAGPRRVGLLLMEEPLSGEHEALLRAAVIPVAIEAVRRDAVATATAESASRLIDELRFGSLRDPEQVLRSAERFGLRLDHRHAAAVFAYEGTNRRTWSTATRWIEMPVREADGLGWTVLTGDIAGELHRIRRRLEGIVGDAHVLGATGATVENLAGTARSFAEAEIVLELLRDRPEARELTPEALGLEGVLLSVPPDRLRNLVERYLGPILDREELLETLEVWFEEHGSRAAVAGRLQVHRNSIGYRMARIRELLGARHPDPWLTLQQQSALAARRVLRALEKLGHA